ncbi:hypothetical protein CR513_55268, partial [Mucuna pruriens]
MKYLISNLVRVIRTDQRVARKCYYESTHVLESRRGKSIMPDEQTQQPDEDLKEIQVVLEPHQRMKIGASLDPWYRPELPEPPFVYILGGSLGESKQEKTCTTINFKFSDHQIGRQNWILVAKWLSNRVGEEKKRVVRAETIKLLQAGFIQEVKYPSWLFNVVMVKKPSSK